MAQVSVSEKIQKNSLISGLEFDERRLTAGQTVSSPVLEKMIMEGGIDFYNYLRWIGLSEQPNIMVLTSMRQYYYDHNDLKNIGVLINMKKLNQVTHLESFIHTLFRLLPYQSAFVGCFCNPSEERSEVARERSVKFFHGFRSAGCRAGRSLTRISVVNMLNNNGFIVKDMTDINGLAYFWAQNNRRLGG
ncbi:MAG TPA: hypothetical protein PLN46_08790 [Bacteroidales bacterium]|nr:hypothetical protein [Bacteroidales bacterium]